MAGITAAGVIMSNAGAETFAERLGWPEGSRVVIFHVDDAGMCHESNEGVRQAMAEGLATSCSVMMPCPWVTEVADYVNVHPEVDIGLHLTLTSEWKRYRWGPVSAAAAGSGLRDPHGYLWADVADVSSQASAEAVDRELRAQLAKAKAMGIVPTHLDSHMGTCFEPAFVESYIRLGIETGIPVMFFGGHMQHVGAYVGARRDQVAAIAGMLWQAGLPVLDDLVQTPTRGTTYEERRGSFVEMLDGLQPGITQVILHCTETGTMFRHISGSGASRQAELDLMRDPAVAKAVEDKGIVLTTWRELLKRRQALGVQGAAQGEAAPAAE